MPSNPSYWVFTQRKCQYLSKELHAYVYCGVIHKVMYDRNMIRTILLQQQNVAVVPCGSCTNTERTWH